MSPNKETEFWVVTGAASGIGAAVVRASRGSGANVLALDVDQTTGLELAAQTGALFRACDVGDFAQWQQFAHYLNSVQTDLGTPTHIHLNAGIQIAPPDAPLSEYQFEAATLSRYKRMMSVNVDGVVFGLQTLLPLLSPGAAIVVTASLAGVTPYAIDPLYAMSKHAVVGLVRSLAPELAKRGIRIHALCPGAVDTNIIPHAQKAEHSQFMSPDDLAADVIGLMTEQQNGKSWVRLRKDKPRYVIRAPGDKSV